MLWQHSSDINKIKNNNFKDVPGWHRETRPLFSLEPAKSLLASILTYLRDFCSNLLRHALQRKLAVLRQGIWTVITRADILINFWWLKAVDVQSTLFEYK